MNNEHKRDWFWEEKHIPNFCNYTVTPEDMTDLITAKEEGRKPGLSHLKMRKAKKILALNAELYESTFSGNPTVMKYDAMNPEMEAYLKAAIGEEHIKEYHYSTRSTAFFIITDVKLDKEVLADCIRKKFDDYFEIFEPEEGYYIIDPIIVPSL